jgi:hypothetical protein
LNQEWLIVVSEVTMKTHYILIFIMGVARSWKKGTSDSEVISRNIGMPHRSVSKMGVNLYFSKGNNPIAGGKLFDFFEKIRTSGCFLDVKKKDIHLLTGSPGLGFNGSTSIKASMYF